MDHQGLGPPAWGLTRRLLRAGATSNVAPAAQKCHDRRSENGRALKPSGEEEYKRYEGMPASLSPACDPGRVDLRWIRRPLTWFRWRAAVRRRGPYGPDFDEFRRAGKSVPGS